MRRGKSGLGGIVAVGIATFAIVAALLSLNALPGDGDVAAANASPESTEAAGELLLRLHDLPLGYRYSGGLPETPAVATGCGEIDPAKPQPRLAEFVDRYAPAGCTALYARLFRVPGAQQPTPLVVGTGALDTGSVAGAEAGLGVSRELLSHLMGDELPAEVPPPETVGDATRLYHWEHSELITLNEEHSSSFLVWRSGDVVAAIFVSGGDNAANDQAAVELARRQQNRIEAPTPYTQAEADDREVPLEDPRLKMPVYWLGRTFTPGHGLPRMHLFNTGSRPHSGLGTQRASLTYLDHWGLSPTEEIFLDIWPHRQWRWLEARKGELPASLSCATAHNLKLPHGHAQILDGFGGFHPTCRHHAWHAYTARIYLPRTVVTVETLDICATCAQAGTGPYDSFKGMAAIARGLERRIRPPAR
ncbi:MAG TPA: hypothetical protein VF085_05615 [Solirubrobacterales bacterium]